MTLSRTLLCMIFTSWVLCCLRADGAHEKQLVPTPPMGWNSWNCVGGEASEELIFGMADAMVESGMRDAGYTYIVIDDMWHKGRVDAWHVDGKGEVVSGGSNVPGRDENGTLIHDAEKFPNGIKYVADYVHAKGLKFGLYTVPGTRTCAGCTGSWEFEERDLKDFSDWGVDFIKLDGCGVPGDVREVMAKWRSLLDGLDRPIVLSVNVGVYDWLGEYADLWRTTPDIVPVWSYKPGRECISASISDIIDLQLGLESLHGKGGWNDPDMLQVGNSLTENENKAHFGMWCILGAPLIAGNDLRQMSKRTQKILTNRELIAVNQDSLDHRGEKNCNLGPGLSIWAKRLNDPAHLAVALLNSSEKPVDMTANFNDLGVRGEVRLRNLFEQEDLGRFKDSYTVNVPRHGVVILKVTASAPIGDFAAIPTIPDEGVILEAEDPMQYYGGATVFSNLENYTGTGYVQSKDHAWRSFEMIFIAPAKEGIYRVQIRYSAPNTDTLKYRLVANNGSGTTIGFPPTGFWSDWRTIECDVPLKQGYNQIRIVSPGPDQNNIAIDHMKITPCETAVNR